MTDPYPLGYFIAIIKTSSQGIENKTPEEYNQSISLPTCPSGQGSAHPVPAGWAVFVHLKAFFTHYLRFSCIKTHF
jgi:hypothetical protein